MRFFKSLNLLHRRTRSETFVPGSPALPLSNRQHISDISSVFDFATSKFTAVPADFKYLRGAANVVDDVSAVSRPQMPNRRDSQSSVIVPSLMVEENLRLREALNLWYQEYSKVEDLLQMCRADLLLEREKSRALQQQSARNQELILDLQRDLERYDHRLEKSRRRSRLGNADQHCSAVATNCDTDEPGFIPGSTNSLALLPAPAPSIYRTTMKIEGKLRTLDEYSSALRMTLTTRRQLRNQKKIAKFWKTKALDTGRCQDIITPSTSAISSVHEPLPPERRAAVEALMQQRGWPYSRSLSKTSSLGNPDQKGLSEPLPSKPFGQTAPSPIHSAQNTNTVTLSDTASKSSSISRLAPLASESLKAEINLFFGIQDTTKRFSTPHKKRRSGSVAFSTATSSRTMEQSTSRLSNVLKVDSLSFDSLGDFGQLFSNLLFQDGSPRVKLPPATTKDTVLNSLTLTMVSEGAQRLALPSSSSHLADSSIPSGSSFVFCESLAALESQQGDVDSNIGTQPGVLQPIDVANSVSRTSMRHPKFSLSWQERLSPALKSVKSKREQSSTMSKQSKRVVGGKENVFSFSRSFSVFKKPSRLPVPSPMKG